MLQRRMLYQDLLDIMQVQVSYEIEDNAAALISAGDHVLNEWCYSC